MQNLTAEQMMQRPEVLAYLSELAADIAAHGGLDGKTMEQAVQEAHDRRQLFAAEMAAGETRRAKMARTALCTSVWIDVTVQHSKEKMVRACEWIEAGRA